jgi:AcrR family transcriptional regulator
MEEKLAKKESVGKILVVAERLFASRGFRGVSLETIAKEAGISKSLIFYYFKNKKSLYEAIIRKSIELILAELKSTLKGAKDPPEKVTAFVERFFKLLLNEENLILILARESSNPVSPMAKYIINQSRRIIDFLSSLIEEGIEQGFFRDVPPRLAAISFFGMLLTYVTAKNVFAKEISSHELAAFNIENLTYVNTTIFLEGLKGC